MPDTAFQSQYAAGSLMDPQTLMRIRNLELRARVVVEGFWNGIHRSPYHGFSAEFTEYRQYTPDDDPRYLDWRVYARSDRYFIKKFEEETNLRCYLLADNSRSMSYGSRGYSKGQYAGTLAATLAYFLHLQGDAVGLLRFDEQIREFLPARHRSGHLRQIMHGLEGPFGGKGTNLGLPLVRIAEIIRKRGLVIMLSDFLAPLERLERDLGALATCGHEVMVFQVLDPAETAFDFEGGSLFEDVESGRTLYIEPQAIRREYRRRLENHCGQLKAACERLGCACYRLETTRPLELALFDVLRQRTQKRRAFHPQSGGRSAAGRVPVLS
jgi:uncharacterized protein (DUF58 family)